MATPTDAPYSDDIKRRYKLDAQLQGETAASLEALGDARLRALVRRVVDDDASHEKRCKLLEEKENYRVYELLDRDNGDHDNDTPPLVTMKGVLLLPSSSCEEVLALLATPAARVLYADLFGSMHVDSTTLHEASSSTGSSSGGSHSSRASTLSTAPLTSSTAFHWLMLRDVSALLPCRDFLFMRSHWTFASDEPTASSRVGWGASVWESVEFPACRPVLPSSVSTRSAFTKCGFVVEAASSDHAAATRVTFFASMPRAAQQQQHQADRQWLRKLAGCVRHVPSAVVNHRIRLGQLVDKRDWAARDACGLCTQTFSKVFRREHHCRLCGGAVCSKCSTLRSDGAVRVCLSCVHGEDASALWGTVRMGHKKLHASSSRTSQSQSRSQSQSVLTASSVSSSRTHSVMAKESWTSSGYNLSGDFTRVSDASFQSSSRSHGGSALEDFLDGDRAYSSHKLSASTLSTSSMSFSSSTSSAYGDEDDVVENSPFEYPLSYAKGNPWPDAPIPQSEQQRLQRIKTLNLSQQYAKENLKELLDLARTSIACGVAAVAAVSVSTILLVTAVGLAGDQLPRDVGFEAHALMSIRPLVVLDTQKDERFAMNPLVSSLNIRFYIGLPLVTKDGVVVGALSLGDTSARTKVSGSDLRSLQRIAARIVAKMDAGAVAETASKVSGMLLI